MDPIVLVDSSEIKDGKIEELKSTFKELAEFVDANEATPISYQVFIDEAQHRVTVLQIHPDSASVENHMTAAAHIFPRFADLLTLKTMDVYGTPSDALLQQLRKKADMLGNVELHVHALHAGVTRF